MLERFSCHQETLLDTLYAAPCDASQWPSFLAKLVSATDSRSARMLVMDRSAQTVLSSLKHNIDDSDHRDYVDYYVNTCPWRPELREKEPGRLYSTYYEFSCPQKDFYRSEFFNDWAGKLDVHHGICGTVWQDDHFTVQLLIQRTRGQGCYSREETSLINTMVPHVRRSIRLASQVEGLHRKQRALAGTLDRRVLPFTIVNAEGRIQYLSADAEAIIADNDNIKVRNGRLWPTNSRQRQRLQALLAHTAAPTSRADFSAGGTFSIERPHLPPLRCLVSPAPRGQLASAPWQINSENLSVVYFYDPATALDIDGALLSELFDLSEAEAFVAMSLALGHSPTDIAAVRGLSVHTVRTQMKAIYRKTGCNRQSELTRLIVSSPASRFRQKPPVNLQSRP